MFVETAFGAHTHNEFNAALQSFVDGCADISKSQRFAGLEPAQFSIQWLNKRCRIVREDSGSRSVHCFVDMATGDVLKADGWAKPAKHARGNIYRPDNGLKAMGPYGAAYLR
jgi:hypothetical protein